MMAIIRDRSLLPDWNDIPPEMIRNCIQEHLKSVPRLDKLESYYLGKHPILARNMDAKGLPNNRLVANHAKYITDIAVGYVMGDPVKYEGDGIDDILEVFKRGDVVSHDAELAKDLSIFGVGRELYYMTSDDNPYPRPALIDPRQIFLVVDDTIEHLPLFGCHFYEKRDISNSVVGYYVNVYTEREVIHYLVKDLGSQTYEELGREPHYFGGVPIVEFWNNEEQQGDFEQQISLIDAYNVLMSDRVNDKEQLVDAILKLKGVSLGDDEEEAGRTIRLLKEYKVLELPSGQDADAAWLIKNLSESDVEVLRNAIRDDIHQFAMVPNLTDKNFAANASGVAMKYKLLGLEQLAIIKERYFKKGLRKRLELFANILRVKGKAVDVSDVAITMTRNLPANDMEAAQMIATLRDMVSNQTLIGQLSFVDDPATENQIVEEEKERSAARMAREFGMPMGDEGDVDAQEQ